MIERHARPRYTLAELLAASDYSLPLSIEERGWIDAPAAGRELLSGHYWGACTVTSWLSRLFRTGPPPRATLGCRMSEAEVLRVARGVLEGHEDSLYVHGARQTPTGIEWRVEARVIGAVPYVRIDDATGAVLEAGRYPTR